jgi:hypothetical protein
MVTSFEERASHTERELKSLKWKWVGFIGHKSNAHTIRRATKSERERKGIYANINHVSGRQDFMGSLDLDAKNPN